MTATHTPGPWTVEYDGSIVMCGQVVSGPIAPDMADGDGVANSRLIAAAPELLAACEALDRCLMRNSDGRYFVCEGRNSDYNTSCDAIHAAIAKARGVLP